MSKSDAYSELFTDVSTDNSTLQDDSKIVGLEGFSNSYNKNNGIEFKYQKVCGLPKILRCGDKNEQTTTSLILSSVDNVNFRLYISERSDVDSDKYQNSFVKLCSTLSSNQTLHIYLGSEVYGKYPVFSNGNMIDAMQRTQGRVITYVNGRAGFCETCLWLYGHERVISEFGSLVFTGLGRTLSTYGEWRPYFETYLNKAKELRLLNDNDIESILTENNNLYLGYRDVIERLNAPINEDNEE